jgi:hypothetical protein
MFGSKTGSAATRIRLFSALGTAESVLIGLIGL